MIIITTQWSWWCHGRDGPTDEWYDVDVLIQDRCLHIQCYTADTLNMYVCSARSDSPLIKVVHAPRAQNRSKSLKVWAGDFEVLCLAIRSCNILGNTLHSVPKRGIVCIPNPRALRASNQQVRRAHNDHGMDGNSTCVSRRSAAPHAHPCLFTRCCRQSLLGCFAKHYANANREKKPDTAIAILDLKREHKFCRDTGGLYNALSLCDRHPLQLHHLVLLLLGRLILRKGLAGGRTVAEKQLPPRCSNVGVQTTAKNKLT